MPPEISPPRVALIGAGGFGAIHIEVLRRLEKSSLARLVAVADPRAGELAAAHGWNSEQTIRLHEDYGEMLEREAFDLLVIAAPPHWHFRMLNDALRRTTAFVYLEKPPVPLVSQLDQLLQTPGSNRVAVGFQALESRTLQDLKTRLVAREIGGIVRVTATASSPRADSYYARNAWAGRLAAVNGDPIFDGPATNAISHLVHTVMFLNGRDRESFARPALVTGRFFRARPIESYDLALLAGQLDNGAAFEITVAHCSHERRPWHIRIEGTEGVLEFHQDDMEQRDGKTLAGLLEDSYLRALAVARNRSARATTTLRDCLGYLETVCGALAASGGIGTLDPDTVERVESNDGVVYSSVLAGELVEHRQNPPGEQASAPFDNLVDLPPPVEADPASRRADILLCAR
jgi:predicted dehydrogenase